MKDGGTSDGLRQGSGRTLGLRQLASEVMAVVAAKAVSTERTISATLVSNMSAAAVAEDPAVLADYIASLRRDKLSAETIADFYIPEVARELGRDWVADRRSFAEVTVGVARLQAQLRQIGMSWAAEYTGSGRQGRILVCVPEEEDHTLGAVVATGILRRKGVSVSLKLKPALGEVIALVADRSYEAILVSWADTERLEIVAKIVAQLRNARGNEAPILVGGAIIGRAEQIVERTGADYATNDLSAVAALVERRVSGGDRPL